MALAVDQEHEQTISNKKLGDGFVIEHGIIKGEEKFYAIGDKSIGELIFETLCKKPEHIAQIEAITGIKKTYKDLKESSTRLAIWMKKEAIGIGNIVSICSPCHSDIDSIIFATMFIGATYATFPQDLNLQLARHYINHIKPRVMFAWKNKSDMLQEAAKLENHDWKMVVLDDHFESSPFSDILRVQSFDEILNFQTTPIMDPENICIITPTSGTTGTPKFVCYSYETWMSWISTFDTNRANVENAHKITLTYLYPEWLVHFEFYLRYFFGGSTQIFHAEFNPYETCRIIEKYKVNTLAMSTYDTSLLCQVNNLNKYDLQSVSLIVPMGTSLFASIDKKLRNTFRNAIIEKGLGMSEMPCLTDSMKCINPESEGTILPNVQLKIVDLKTGATLGQNQVGEICAKTLYTMTGYYKDPVATKLAFDGEGWFHTGDEGYYDENGEIFVVGRLKEMIRFRHVDIHPSYIEELLLCHPDIIDAAVVGIRHDVDVERPVLFVTRNPASNLTEEDILKLTSDLEYSDAFKDSIIFIDKIPRSVNGKIRRRILREHAEKFYTHRQKDL